MSPSTKLKCALIGSRLAIVILGTNANSPTARLSKQMLSDKYRIRSSGPRIALPSSTRSYACMASAARSATSIVPSIKSTDSTTDSTLQPLRAFSCRLKTRHSLCAHTHLPQKPFRYSPRSTKRVKIMRSQSHARPVKSLTTRSQT